MGVSGGTQGLGETIATLAADSGAAGIGIVGRDRSAARRDRRTAAACLPRDLDRADLGEADALPP